MSQDPAQARKRSVGRPRSQAAKRAILDAAAAILAEKGPTRVTVEAVATRAGVGKPTIYRYWKNAQALAMAALMAGPPLKAADDATAGEERDPLEALRAQVRGVAAAFRTKRGRQAALLMAASDADSELSKAFRNQVILASREQGRVLLARAVEDGALAATLPMETALDLVYGPLFYRLLTRHAPLSEGFADEVAALAISALTQWRPG